MADRTQSVEECFFFRIKESSVRIENIVKEFIRHAFFFFPAPRENRLGFAGNQTRK